MIMHTILGFAPKTMEPEIIQHIDPTNTKIFPYDDQTLAVVHTEKINIEGESSNEKV